MKMKELLTDESKWCQGAEARDKDGNLVPVDSEDACQYCLYGAFIRCYGKTAYIDKWEVRDSLAGAIGPSMIHWNDIFGRTFDEVKALLEELDI